MAAGGAHDTAGLQTVHLLRSKGQDMAPLIQAYGPFRARSHKAKSKGDCDAEAAERAPVQQNAAGHYEHGLTLGDGIVVCRFVC